MGIRFDESIFTKLTEDYGGHPFLIRQVCSAIAKKYPARPVQIDRVKYSAVRDTFNLESDYFNMLLDVLKQFYMDEYEMLTMLATDNKDDFLFFANQDYSMVKHLIGYGIIRVVDDNYDFQIDALKEYLKRQAQKTPVGKSTEERWSFICTQRGQIETNLRKMVKAILRIAYKSEAAAKEVVVNKLHGSDARKYSTVSYADLFDSRVSTIYLKNLKDLITANWEYFKDFWNAQDTFVLAMTILNKEGRYDAHATIPDDNELILIQGAIDTVRKGMDKYFEIYC